jgi:uncharacterized protein
MGLEPTTFCMASGSDGSRRREPSEILAGRRVTKRERGRGTIWNHRHRENRSVLLAPGGPAIARPTPEQLVELWSLRTMPTENVRFSQSYVDNKSGPDGKPLCSAIVALLVDDPSVFSDMHRLPTDEIWHFYLGDPIELLLLYPDGSDELVILGHDVLAGQRVQTVVAAGVYMGARLRPGGEFAVYGNTMAPGFVLGDFEGASAEELIAGWPQQAELIRALTRE